MCFFILWQNFCTNRFITAKRSARWFRRKIRCYLHQSTTNSPASQHLTREDHYQLRRILYQKLEGKYFF
jgi:hypothetical protein